MTLTWKKHNRWMKSCSSAALWCFFVWQLGTWVSTPCLVQSFCRNCTRYIAQAKTGAWETTFLLEPDHHLRALRGLTFQTQACLVFAARKDENRKDVRQLHQSARIPLPPPTSALELYIWFFKGDDSRHKFQFHLGHYKLWWWISC